MAPVVVIFDFDRTVIDGDSDNWIVTEMGIINLFHQLLRTMPWTSLMNRMMEELHSLGKTVDDIEECLKRVPLHPSIITAIKSSHELGCDLKIISDANQFFIETILKHHGVFEYFSEITTNPTFVDEKGQLNITPYHNSASSPHGCNLCPPNLCKGLVIDQIRDSDPGYKRKVLIYLGDGRGDYCPSIKLGEGNHVMPRNNFPLWELICENPATITAKVHKWSNEEELERILVQLISASLVEGNTKGAFSISNFN